jgi:CBS domain-containing protein
MRFAGKYAGIRLGIRWARWRGELGPHAGLGMLCQAGVAIGLADFLTDAWRASTDVEAGPHPLALHFKTIVLGAVVIFELLGPVVLKGVVKRAGEVKAITLLRRARPAPVEGVSVLRQTWESMLRSIGVRQPGRTPNVTTDLQARHIMRSNVKLLPAGASLDDVLHFVEESKYNHFPVVDDAGAFAGMIHFSDLREIIYDPTTQDLVTAVDLAAPDDMVPADMPLEELMAEFDRRDVGALVVVQSRADRRVLGMVEQRDLLRAVRRDEAT